jgi:hypothetical protein
MRKVLILIGIGVLVFIGVYFALSFYAVKWIEPHLQKAMGPGITVKRIEIKFRHLSVQEVQYEDPPSKQKLMQIEEIRIYPSVLSFLKGSLDIKELSIVQPAFFFSRSRDGILRGPLPPVKIKGDGKEVSGKEVPGKGDKKEDRPLLVKINHFRIRNGSIDFEDSKTGGPPAEIKLRNLELELRDIRFPIISTRVPIELKGKIRGKTKEGEVYTKGWIDPMSMDMETLFQVREVDVKTFAPYYRKRSSAEVESGYADMEAKITVKKRVIDAPGQLDVVDLRIKEEGTILWIPAKTLVSLLKDKGNRVKVRFHVKGNLDDPQFDLQETFLTRIALSFAESLGVPVKIVGETVFEGAKKGAGGLVEGLKSIGEIFKKKSDRERQ